MSQEHRTQSLEPARVMEGPKRSGPFCLAQMITGAATEKDEKTGLLAKRGKLSVCY